MRDREQLCLLVAVIDKLLETNSPDKIADFVNREIGNRDFKIEITHKPRNKKYPLFEQTRH